MILFLIFVSNIFVFDRLSPGNSNNSHTPLYKRAVAELASCVHKSVFALKLLPPDACPSLICIFCLIYLVSIQICFEHGSNW